MQYAALSRPHRQDNTVKQVIIGLALAIGTAGAMSGSASAQVCTSTGPLCVAPSGLSASTAPVSPLVLAPVFPVSGSTGGTSPFSIAPGGPVNPVIRPVPLVGVFR